LSSDYSIKNNHIEIRRRQDIAAFGYFHDFRHCPPHRLADAMKAFSGNLFETL
jgi:hypothetical protein